MKPLKELQSMLVDSLSSYRKVSHDLIDSDNYNEATGDTSFLLAAILNIHLHKAYKSWAKGKWFDDSLLSKVVIRDYNIIIGGIMIWGVENTTQQWTSPFYFEIIFNESYSDFNSYFFLFNKKNKKSITYSEFNKNRDYWDRDSLDFESIDHSQVDWEFKIIEIRNKR